MLRVDMLHRIVNGINREVVSCSFGSGDLQSQSRPAAAASLYPGRIEGRGPPK